jgi:hypothetical protein
MPRHKVRARVRSEERSHGYEPPIEHEEASPSRAKSAKQLPRVGKRTCRCLNEAMWVHWEQSEMLLTNVQVYPLMLALYQSQCDIRGNGDMA